MNTSIKNHSISKSIKDTIINFHNFNLSLRDNKIDELLRLNSSGMEDDDSNTLNKMFGQEQFFYEGTPYSYIRKLIHVLNPQADDVVYDLGSGYGRFVIYGGLVSPSFYKGVELVPDRVKTAREAQNFLQIENIDFKDGNVKDEEINDGNVFFLFNPFTLPTLEVVGQNLKLVAKSRKIKIATWGGTSNDYFSDQSWLSELKNSDLSEIQLFQSIL